MSWKKRKVLVTGADGFIGSHLTGRLIREGAKVRAFTFYNAFNHWGWLENLDEPLKKKMDVFCGDVRDPNGVAAAMEGVDVVFHLAALIGIPFSYHSPDSYIDTNVKGTLNILQAARRFKVGKIIHTSTSEVYGTAQYTPMDEQHPVNPQSPYAASKAAADTLALSFYRSFGLPVVIARPFNTYGPRQSARAIIPTILSQVLAGQNTVKVGNLHAKRDFTYVEDTVEAFLALAGSDKAVGEVVHFGSGREVSIRQLADIIVDVTGAAVKIRVDHHRLRPTKSEVGRLLCDFAKMRAVCGWQPRVHLEEGIKQTARWLKKNLNAYKPEIYNV